MPSTAVAAPVAPLVAFYRLVYFAQEGDGRSVGVTAGPLEEVLSQAAELPAGTWAVRNVADEQHTARALLALRKEIKRLGGDPATVIW
jgi:hypothetical protein